MQLYIIIYVYVIMHVIIYIYVIIYNVLLLSVILTYHQNSWTHIRFLPKTFRVFSLLMPQDC